MLSHSKSAPIKKIKTSAATIGAKIETAINVKYHLGTFERSTNSTIKEMIKIKKKINEKTIVNIEAI
jgi:hypothetical protein